MGHDSTNSDIATDFIGIYVPSLHKTATCYSKHQIAHSAGPPATSYGRIVIQEASSYTIKQSNPERSSSCRHPLPIERPLVDAGFTGAVAV